MHEGRRQPSRQAAYAGSRLKLNDELGRSRLTGQPSSRTGENPPYGMIGGIEETSASFEARSAPRSHPTGGRGWKHPRLPGHPVGPVSKRRNKAIAAYGLRRHSAIAIAAGSQ